LKLGGVVRLFTLVGALLIAGGTFLLVDGGIRVGRCMSTDVLSLAVWRSEFWLLIPGKPDLGLSHNAHWFLRIVGGLLITAIGAKVVKVATR
jgi:hypothetical protein